MKINEDWLINNYNIFGLNKETSLAISAIQYEISNQFNGKSNLTDYLGFEIDITIPIKLTKELTIESLITDYLGFDFNPFQTKTFKVFQIVDYLKLSLFDNYTKENCKNILTFSAYKKQYTELLDVFIKQNIDTDENDFINSELKLCEHLNSELVKPVYNEINILGSVFDKASDFKKNLNNSIDKRRKHLNGIEVIEKNDEDYLITPQSTFYHRRTKEYVFSDAEKRKLEHQISPKNLDNYYKKIVEDDNKNYQITNKAEIDNLINLALKRDYTLFNAKKKNYRIKSYAYLGNIEIFKIRNNEYLIEGSKSEKERYTIHIYNFEYNKKWLDFLDNLIGNYCFGQFTGFKEDIIEDALTKEINNIENLAEDIEKIFFHCLDFHNNRNFEGINHATNRHTLFGAINRPGGIFWWKQKKENEFNISIGNLLERLEDLFISASPNKFMQTRDFISLWIEKIIGVTINNDKKMFQWGYSPFMNDVLNLDKKIKELFSDDRISLKNNLNTDNQTQTGKQISLQTKNKIAHQLIGDNKTSYTSILYHHINDILNKYKISHIEARQILLDMKGSFSPLQNEVIVEPIILYLQRSSIETAQGNSINNEPQQQLRQIKKEQLFEKQNKLTPKVSLENVFSHFEILTQTTNRNDEFYLTKEQLLNFINSTFIELEPQKQNFNCDGFVKKDIRKIFYNFYFKNKNKETNRTSLKRKYFNLMNDAFHGFNENDYTDFAK